MCSQNKQRLLSYTALTVGFYNGGGECLAPFGLGPYITQTRFYFKGLNLLIKTNHLDTFYRVLIVLKCCCITKSWTRLWSTGTPNFTCSYKDKFVITIKPKAKCLFHVATSLLFCILRRNCLRHEHLLLYVTYGPAVPWNSYLGI